MPLTCCAGKDPVFGKTIEEMLDKSLTVRNEKRLVPIEIQQFVNYLAERNAIQFKELFINTEELKERNKLIKKINKAGNIDLKNTHNIHLVISVFLDFLRRMPGRVISKDKLTKFKNISDKGKKKDIKKVKEGLTQLSQPRYETLKYLMSFFTGRIGNKSCNVKIDTSDVLSIAPIIASALIETPNDYTLPSKIYKNGNLINYIPNSEMLETIKIRENIIRILIVNFSTFFQDQPIQEQKPAVNII